MTTSPTAAAAAPARHEWRRIPGFDGYAVSRCGLVASFRRAVPRLLKPSGGAVILDGTRHSVAGLVHLCFPPPRPAVPPLSEIPFP